MSKIKNDAYMKFLIHHYDDLGQSLLKLESAMDNYEKGTNEWHAAIDISVGIIEYNILQVKELSEIPETFISSHKILLDSMQDFEQMIGGLVRWAESKDREIFAVARGFEHLSKKKWEEARLEANRLYLEGKINKE